MTLKLLFAFIFYITYKIVKAVFIAIIDKIDHVLLKRKEKQREQEQKERLAKEKEERLQAEKLAKKKAEDQIETVNKLIEEEGGFML